VSKSRNRLFTTLQTIKKDSITNGTHIDDVKNKSENDRRSSEKQFTATGSGNLWNAEANILMGRALTYKNAGHAAIV
jgi:hypothetical protein